MATQGMDVCLVKMPLRLAILGIDKADSILPAYDYSHWYIGGHSLGGTCSALYAGKHAGQFDAIFFLASYPAKQMEDSIDTVFIYGTEDKVMNMDNYQINKDFAPGYSEWVIKGGNHSQFGSYGHQKGDGIATITPEEQIQQTVQAIFECLDQSNGN